MQPLLDSYGRPEDRSCHEVEWRENILCGGRHLILWHFEKNGTHHFSLIDHHLQSVGQPNRFSNSVALALTVTELVNKVPKRSRKKELRRQVKNKMYPTTMGIHNKIDGVSILTLNP